MRLLFAVVMVAIASSGSAQNQPGDNQGGSEPQLAKQLEVLKLYHQTANPKMDDFAGCDQKLRIQMIERANSNYKLGMYADAEAGFRHAAHAFAVCALGTNRLYQGPRLTIAAAAKGAGVALMNSVLAQKATGVILPPTRVDARNALILLEADPAGNAQAIATLKASGLVDDKSAGRATR